MGLSSEVRTSGALLGVPLSCQGNSHEHVSVASLSSAQTHQRLFTAPRKSPNA